jgi:hypothetical protein
MTVLSLPPKCWDYMDILSLLAQPIVEKGAKNNSGERTVSSIFGT